MEANSYTNPYPKTRILTLAKTTMPRGSKRKRRRGCFPGRTLDTDTYVRNEVRGSHSRVGSASWMMHLPMACQIDVSVPLPVVNARELESLGGKKYICNEEVCDVVYKALNEALPPSNSPASAVIEARFVELLSLPWSSMGDSVALSANSSCEEGCTFAVIPGGTLILWMDEEAQKTVGVPFIKVTDRLNGNRFFLCSVDMSRPIFRKGKPLFDRIEAYFGSNLVRFMLWRDPSFCTTKVCLPDPSGWEETPLSMWWETVTLDSISIPSLSLTRVNSLKDAHSRRGILLDAFEYLGCVSCYLTETLNTTKETDTSHTSTFQSPSLLASDPSRSLLRFRLRGLVPGSVAQKVVVATQDLACCNVGEWIAVTAWAHRECPVSLTKVGGLRVTGGGDHIISSISDHSASGVVEARCPRLLLPTKNLS